MGEAKKMGRPVGSGKFPVSVKTSIDNELDGLVLRLEKQYRWTRAEAVRFILQVGAAEIARKLDIADDFKESGTLNRALTLDLLKTKVADDE